jgi:hypothetical protein
MTTLQYHQTAERPDIQLWVLDDDGTLINLATGYTFEFKIGKVGAEADLTKTTGITGAAGSGTETSGVPNCVIAFSAGELADVPVGTHCWQLRLTTTGVDRVIKGHIEILGVIL